MSNLAALEGHEKQVNYCGIITAGVNEAARIIGQLLQLSRPTSAKLAPTDLGAIVAEACSILGYRFLKTGVRLDLVIPSTKVRILADADQIKQVVLNLLVNAVDAMEHAPVKELGLTLRVQGLDALLCVSDTGHGINPELLDRVFDPFFTTKRPDRGRGLGLSLCLSILKQHKGEILVHSTPGAGSVFELHLPTLPEVGLEGSVVGQVQGGLQSECKVRTMAKLDVLVVDDEEHIQAFVLEVLQIRKGWQVERASNGLQAIRHLESGRFGLVVTDLTMPELDGFGLIRWIKEARPELATRTLVITGDQGAQEAGLERLPMGLPVLRKPFTSAALLDGCDRLLA